MVTIDRPPLLPPRIERQDDGLPLSRRRHRGCGAGAPHKCFGRGEHSPIRLVFRQSSSRPERSPRHRVRRFHVLRVRRLRDSPQEQRPWGHVGRDRHRAHARPPTSTSGGWLCRQGHRRRWLCPQALRRWGRHVHPPAVHRPRPGLCGRRRLVLVPDRQGRLAAAGGRKGARDG
jgi:hypothetical protein